MGASSQLESFKNIKYQLYQVFYCQHQHNLCKPRLNKARHNTQIKYIRLQASGPYGVPAIVHFVLGYFNHLYMLKNFTTAAQTAQKANAKPTGLCQKPDQVNCQVFFTNWLSRLLFSTSNYAQHIQLTLYTFSQLFLANNPRKWQKTEERMIYNAFQIQAYVFQCSWGREWDRVFPSNYIDGLARTHKLVADQTGTPTPLMRTFVIYPLTLHKFNHDFHNYYKTHIHTLSKNSTVPGCHTLKKTQVNLGSCQHYV